MPDIVFFAVKLAFLALLWLFVFAAVRVIRADLTPRTARRPATAPAARVAAPVAAAPSPATPDSGTRGRRRPRPPREMVVASGPEQGRRVALRDEPITVGRAPDSTLVLSDEYVSNRHARLVPRPDGWYVEDVGSTNGTYLDNQRLTGPVPLPPGRPVRVGQTLLELR